MKGCPGVSNRRVVTSVTLARSRGLEGWPQRRQKRASGNNSAPQLVQADFCCCILDYNKSTAL
jgi:hypothetical protein